MEKRLDKIQQFLRQIFDDVKPPLCIPQKKSVTTTKNICLCLFVIPYLRDDKTKKNNNIFSYSANLFSVCQCIKTHTQKPNYDITLLQFHVDSFVY